MDELYNFEDMDDVFEEQEGDDEEIYLDSGLITTRGQNRISVAFKSCSSCKKYQIENSAICRQCEIGIINGYELAEIVPQETIDSQEKVEM